MTRVEARARGDGRVEVVYEQRRRDAYHPGRSRLVDDPGHGVRRACSQPAAPARGRATPRGASGSGRWCSSTSCCRSAQFTEFDAHYFPEREVPFTRLSEPKNYSVRTTPAGPHGALRRDPVLAGGRGLDASPEDELGRRVAAGIAGRRPRRCRTQPVEVVVKRLENAYPIYDLDSEARFAVARPLARSPSPESSRSAAWACSPTTTRTMRCTWATLPRTACAPTALLTMHAWEEHRKAFQGHVVED